MGTELPTKVMLEKMLVLMQMTFLNNVRKVGRLVRSRTSCTIQVCSVITYITCTHVVMESNRGSHCFHAATMLVLHYTKNYYAKVV
jgi:hypothetical protein